MKEFQRLIQNIGSSHQNLSSALSFMQLELKQLLGEFQEWSDSDSDDSDDSYQP